jgi:hypothetical protein
VHTPRSIATLILLCIGLMLAACEKQPKPTAREEQSESYTRAYVAISQKRPPDMKSLTDMIGSRPAQCEFKGQVVCNCEWRFLINGETKKIVVMGEPPRPIANYSVQLLNTVTGQVQTWSGDDVAKATAVTNETVVDHYGVNCFTYPNHPKCRHKYAFIPTQQYLVRLNSCPGGALVLDASYPTCPSPPEWMSGSDLQPSLNWASHDWYSFASKDDMVNDSMAKKYANVDISQWASFCTTSQVQVWIVTLDKDEPLIFQAALDQMANP